MKLCTDCAHFRLDHGANADLFGKCAKYLSHASPVDGSQTIRLASYARADAMACGLEARHWHPSLGYEKRIDQVSDFL